MIYTLVSRSENSRRLILIFAGWGIDSGLFRTLEKKGYDIAVVWNYEAEDKLTELEKHLKDYEEICIIAWSFGVLMAGSYFSVVPSLQQKASLRLAVAGTEWPVDDSLGIPVKIFNATLEGLSSRESLTRFHRRICGGARAFSLMPLPEQEPDITLLRRQLDFLGKEALKNRTSTLRWDRALITGRDLIFPPSAQERAWKSSPSSPAIAVHEDAAHLPDFQSILDRYVIPKAAVAPAFEKSRETYRSNADVQARIAGIMAEKARSFLSGIRKPMVLEIGCGTGILSEELASMVSEHGGSLGLWDLMADSPLAPEKGPYRRCDAEIAINSLEPSSLDLIISASTAQWFNSPVEFIRRAWHAIRPGAALLLSLFSHPNLPEAACALGSPGLPLLSISEWENALESLNLNANALEIEEVEMTIDFENPVDVFRHFKLTGVNTLGTGKASLHGALEKYPRTVDGKCRLTYRPLFIYIHKKQ